MDIERKCTNCAFDPCTRKECNENGSCIYQKFPHEKVIEEFYKKYPDWEGLK